MDIDTDAFIGKTLAANGITAEQALRVLVEAILDQTADAEPNEGRAVRATDGGKVPHWAFGSSYWALVHFLSESIAANERFHEATVGVDGDDADGDAVSDADFALGLCAGMRANEQTALQNLLVDCWQANADAARANEEDEADPTDGAAPRTDNPPFTGLRLAV